MPLTEHGFSFGPMLVERAVADERYGYAIHVTIGKRLFSIESSPKGRNTTIREYKGKNQWETVR